MLIDDYDYFLFDLDQTLLNFNKGSRKAIKESCALFNIPYSLKFYNRYEKINLKYWHMLEKGEVTQEELTFLRFKEFFEKEKMDTDPVKFNRTYMENLSCQHYPMPYMRITLKKLQEKGKKIYLVSNGVAFIQKRRLELSGLDKIFDDCFISGIIGYSKPDKEYFDYVFDKLKISKEKTLLVGDSLNADIKGAVNYGIDSCWITKDNSVNNTNIRPTYRINSLKGLWED